jgi:transposase
MGAGRQLLYLPPYSPNLNPINQVQDAIAQILLRPPRERRAEFDAKFFLENEVMGRLRAASVWSSHGIPRV